MQNEMRNCLDEAKQVAASMGCARTGKGRWHLKVTAPYYCRSTDALAGYYSIVDHRSDDIEELNKMVLPYVCEEEMSIQVIDTAPVSEVEIEGEEVPF